MNSAGDCPACSDPESSSTVLETRRRGDRTQLGGAVYRRRECSACQHRWTTWELTAGQVTHLLERADAHAAGANPPGTTSTATEGRHAQ